MKDFIKKFINYFFIMKYLFIIKRLQKEKKLALFISHDMSLSGAPLVLYNAIEHYINIGYTPVFVSLNYGNLYKKLNENNIMNMVLFNKNKFLWKKLKKLNWEFIFVNTIVSLKKVDEDFLNIECKKVLWIHEGFDYFNKCEHLSLLNDSRLCKYFVSDWSYKAYESKFSKMIDKPQLLRYSINKIVLEKEDTKYDFIIIGSICERKNQNWIINVFSTLPENILNKINVLFLGKTSKDSYSKEFLSLINKYSWANYYGLATHDETLELINKSKALICPSIDDPLPVVVAESLMLGKPVFTSNMTGFATLIINGKNGFVFDLNSTENIKNQVIDFYCNAYNFENNCLELFDTLFNNEIFYKKLEEIIK